MKYLALLLPVLLLTGCTDIRTRISPDILAADTGSPAHFAMHASQSDTVITADADDPCLLHDALQNASGAEISAGHLSLLLLGGDPAAVLEPYFRAGWVSPSCAVLAVPEDACGLLCAGDAPAPDILRAAVETGMLPARPADAVIGDLWGGSGITALHCQEHGGLTLMLCAADGMRGTLSADACRGLALLGNRFRRFDFAAADGVHSVAKADLRISCTQINETRCISAEGYLDVTQPSDASAAVLHRMLYAALTETVLQGADILMLRECAVRGGDASAAFLTQAEWREQLCAAGISVQIEQSVV